jgi:hypothetical protein
MQDVLDMMFLDSLLEPMLTIALGGGPIKTMPSSASLSANLAFSLKNPYLNHAQCF